ncbi:MAG: ubiquinol oxidase subunit II [Caulobacteraceae bacterium]|nr:ubiquinol oxidase subunit II [Caulobacteraceae bacterium]
MSDAPVSAPALFSALPTAQGMVVMHPAGDIAFQQRDLILISTVLMLLIIVPVILLTLAFAWKYRSTNTRAEYDPDWHHSTRLEMVIWAAPLVIIIILGAITWKTTHLLDPYRPLDRIGAAKPVPAGVKPLRVEVVALDWKWLFIYPDYGVATVNELAAPVDVPIDFRITSNAVMNSFFVPALAGQIYAMPGMDTKLHAVINQPGNYYGESANYSGAGFSGMHFQFQGLTQAGFDQWIAAAHAAGGNLDRAAYLQLEAPSQDVPPQAYAAVAPNLYDAILNRCVEPGKMCSNQMAAIDARGGLGPAGVGDVRTLEYDKTRRRGGAYVASLCNNNGQTPAAGAKLAMSRTGVAFK